MMREMKFEWSQWNDIAPDTKDAISLLRYNVFYEELGWRAGLIVRDNTETDEYDNDNATYLFSRNDKGVVDATCRLIPTNLPYMLNEKYPQAITHIEIPRREDVWEISRFCASVEVRIAAQNNITGRMIGAIIEFGLMKRIKNFISLSTDSILPVVRRCSGWIPEKIGPLYKTPEDKCYAVMYVVDEVELDKVKNKIGVDAGYHFLQG